MQPRKIRAWFIDVHGAIAVPRSETGPVFFLVLPDCSSNELTDGDSCLDGCEISFPLLIFAVSALHDPSHHSFREANRPRIAWGS